MKIKTAEKLLYGEKGTKYRRGTLLPAVWVCLFTKTLSDPFRCGRMCDFHFNEVVATNDINLTITIILFDLLKNFCLLCKYI